MARLIRLDRTGHTTLAEWTNGDLAAREAAVAGLPARARQRHACQRPSRGRQRRGRQGAAAGRGARGAAPPDRRRLVERSRSPADRRRAATSPRRMRSGGARRRASGRCAATGGGGRRGRPGSWSCSRPPGSPCCSSPRSRSRSRWAASRTRGSSPGSRRAGEGARSCRSAASELRPAPPALDSDADGVALGLLADLVGHTERELLGAIRSGPRARRAGHLAGRRAGGADGQAWGPPGGLLVRSGRRAGWAAGRRPRRPPAAGPARGRTGLREGRESRLLGCGVAGSARDAGALACGAGRGRSVARGQAHRSAHGAFRPHGFGTRTWA